MKKMRLTIKHIFLISIAIIFAFPFVWMVFGVFKTNNEIWQEPYKLLPSHWDIAKVVESLGQINFNGYMLNSFYVGIFGTLSILIVALLFTYVVVFLKNKNTNFLFVLVLATYMLPSAVTYVPSYVILAKMDLLNKLNGMIFSCLASVFAVFYLRQSFLKMSYDFVEAARIDGANDFKIIYHVIFPMNKSAFYTVGVLTFVQLYNSYMWPSIMINDDKKFLVSQGLRQFFIQDGAYGMNWSEVMLASTLTLLPVILIFIIGQKWFVTGIVQDSGIKG
ncbi:carbohydrate ABC transporter permease [Vallitalea pronyensis]|uniref:Carbohydrate ABC transporter permease n=1 Tax=Vallitalea pronyensis TaxID=1348613 RepID=A0A8J8MJA1_9FIRM|nr:carbohydrate ABC transporter permease [Vallitalea pronyensis]QUI22609.1 carbohydrate ABC transporter permease [Vallitalea pronyensis]